MVNLTGISPPFPIFFQWNGFVPPINSSPSLWKLKIMDNGETKQREKNQEEKLRDIHHTNCSAWVRERGANHLDQSLRVFGFYIFVVSFVIKTNISNWVNILPTTNVISSYFCPLFFFLLILNIPYFLFKNLIFASKAAYIKGNIVLADMKRWDCKIASGQWAFAAA